MPEVKARLFGEHETMYERSHQIWVILVSHVMSRKPGEDVRTTYGDLAEKLGFDPRAGHTLGKSLGLIGKFCQDNNLPPLNTIVVNASTRDPGEAVVHTAGIPLEDDQEAVRKYPWFRVRVPSPGQFRRIWDAWV